MTPHMYVRNHMLVPIFAWYLRINIGCGTGNNPTKVPLWRKLNISDSSVRPLESYHIRRHCKIKSNFSIHNFSTWGTKTCRSLIIVCRGNFCFQLVTHFVVGIHSVDEFSDFLCFGLSSLVLQLIFSVFIDFLEWSVLSSSLRSSSVTDLW